MYTYRSLFVAPAASGQDSRSTIKCNSGRRGKLDKCTLQFILFFGFSYTINQWMNQSTMTQGVYGQHGRTVVSVGLGLCTATEPSSTRRRGQVADQRRASSTHSALLYASFTVHSTSLTQSTNHWVCHSVKSILLSTIQNLLFYKVVPGHQGLK